MQHHLTGSRDAGGANGSTKSDRVEPAAAWGTVGPVEGRGAIKRYRTSPRQSSLEYPQVAGLTRWDRPTGAAAIGKIIIDGGARSHFPWPLNWATDTKDSSGFGPRTLNGEPGSCASRRSPGVDGLLALPSVQSGCQKRAVRTRFVPNVREEQALVDQRTGKQAGAELSRVGQRPRNHTVFAAPSLCAITPCSDY